MKKLIVLSLILALVLSACGSAATPQESAAPAAAAAPIAPTAQPAQETSPAAIVSAPDEVIIRDPERIPTPPIKGTPTPIFYQKRGNVEIWSMKDGVELDTLQAGGVGLVLLCAADGPLPIGDTIAAIILIAGVTYYVVAATPAFLKAVDNLYYSIHWTTANTAVVVPNVVEIKSLRNIKGLPDVLKGVGEIIALKEITSGALYFCGNDGGAGTVEKFGFPDSKGGFFVSLGLKGPCARTAAGILESLRRLLEESKRLESGGNNSYRLIRIVLEDWIKAFEALLK
jgi:hypothetical protein